jgi:hypothetical protein
MPRVPVLDINNRVSEVGPNLPTPDPRNAGIVAGSLSQLGGTLGKVGTELYRRRQAEDLKHWENQTSNDFKQDLGKYYNDLAIKYANSDHDGFASEFQQGADKMRAQYMKKADTDAKSKMFDYSADNLTTQYAINADTYQRKEKLKYDYRAERDLINTIGEDGDYVSANMELKKQEEFIKTSDSFYPEQKEELKKALENKSSDIIRTMINNGQHSLAKDILNGKDPKNSDAFAKNISAFEKSKLNSVIENEIKREQAQNYQVAISNINNAMKAVETGELKESDPLILKAKSMVNILPADKQLEVKSKLAQISLTKEITDSMATIPMSDEQIDQRVDSAMAEFKRKDPLLGASVTGETKQVLKNQAQKLRMEMIKDPSNYFFKHDKKIKELASLALSSDPNSYGPTNYEAYKASLNSHYDNFVIPEAQRKYGNILFEKRFGDTLKEIAKNKPAKADQLATQVLTDLERMAGDDAGKLLGEFGVDKKYRAAGAAIIPIDRQRILSNMFNPIDMKAYKAEFNKAPDDIQSDLSEFLDTDVVQAYKEIPYDPEAYNNASIIANTMHDEFMRLKTLKYSDTEARKEAQKLFTNSYDAIYDSDHSVLIPNKIVNTSSGAQLKKYDKDNISNFLQNYVDNKRDLPAFRAGNYKWVTTPERDGVMLMTKITGSNKFEVYSENNDNKELRFTFDQIDSQKSPEPKSWMRKHLENYKKNARDRLIDAGYIPLEM